MQPSISLLTIGVADPERPLAFYRDTRVIDQARRAGTSVVKPGQDTFWGRCAGYFRDPDDHLWEVSWNPNLQLTD